MSRLLEHLSREIGRDAREEANRRHPELRTLPDAHVAELISAVDYVMEYQNWPRTVENAERAYRVLEAWPVHNNASPAQALGDVRAQIASLDLPSESNSGF